METTRTIRILVVSPMIVVATTSLALAKGPMGSGGSLQTRAVSGNVAVAHSNLGQVQSLRNGQILTSGNSKLKLPGVPGVIQPGVQLPTTPLFPRIPVNPTTTFPTLPRNPNFPGLHPTLPPLNPNFPTLP